MGYVLGTTPGGNKFIDGASTFSGVFPEGSQAVALDRDQLDEKVKTDAAALTGFIGIDPSTGYSVAFQDAEGRVGELSMLLDGKIPQWVLDRWADRLRATSAFQRDALVAAFKQRRGQRIGTNGRAVVCLRFDHGWNKFVTDVLPLLRARSLSCTQMVNPAAMTDTTNNAVTYADIQAMWLNDGIEIANHGQDHSTVTSHTGIHNHIVGALQDIQANLPHSKVETYIPGGQTGEGSNDFAGRTFEEFYQTTGGALSMRHHAAVFGYIPGFYRSLPQDMNLGGGHASADTWTLANLKAAVDDTTREGAATTFLFHPELIGTTGNITLADFTVFLDYVRDKRDSGGVEVLTMTGSLLADPNTRTRHDLIHNGAFRDGLTGWSNTAGWTAASSNGVTYATASAGTTDANGVTTGDGKLLRQFEGGRHLQQVESSNRELVARFRSPDGATVRVSVTSGANGLAATRDVTIPASTAWVTVRQPFSIPLGGSSLTFDVGRVSGGAVDMTDVRSHTI